MKVYVCTNCGSANIQQDAWEVTRAFNIYTDLYKEST